jgi:aspartyl-tRNA(Asn)/glutamyl-tRNA(Gln) amidotransferase subunit C
MRSRATGEEIPTGAKNIPVGSDADPKDGPDANDSPDPIAGRPAIPRARRRRTTTPTGRRRRSKTPCSSVGSGPPSGRRKHVPAAASGLTETLTPGPERPRGMSDGDDEPAVTGDEVRKVADLARVDLTDEEVEQFAEQFEAVLADFETLDEVPEVESEPDLVNVMRADEVEEGLSQEEALSNASETEDGYFKGPRVS